LADLFFLSIRNKIVSESIFNPKTKNKAVFNARIFISIAYIALKQTKKWFIFNYSICISATAT